MTPDSNLPNLFNYDGKPFDVRDVIGCVDKDDNGNMIPVKKGPGKLADKLGRPINPKGYLVDKNGNVIDKNGEPIFAAEDLKDDEIPKIFPFTKFNKPDF